MKLALGQINPTVGDFSGNVKLMIDAAARAADSGAGLVLFPELALSGYPPQDLVEVPSYLDQNQSELCRLARETATLGIDLVCGYVGRATGRGHQKAANCAAYLCGGEVLFTQQKMLLPTYDVFDEWRYFEPAERQAVFEHRGIRFGITICEDIWNDKQFWPRPLYGRDPVEELIAEGVDLLINISSSPYHMGKRELRLEMIQAVAQRHNLPAAMVNQVGGNDQLVFDGSSFVVGSDGELRASALTFAEDMVLYDTEIGHGEMHAQTEGETEAVYDGLVVGTRDYVRKCGFQEVIVGLSGGIDSSVTAIIGADAVGSENMIGVAMPGPTPPTAACATRATLRASSAFALRSSTSTKPTARSRKRWHRSSRTRPRRHGRKRASSAAREHTHGVVEQIRGACADHGQQERIGCWILHPVRRHVRRAGRNQRRAQETSFTSWDALGTAGTPTRYPSRFSKNPLRPNSVPTRKTPTRCRITRSSTRS